MNRVRTRGALVDSLKFRETSFPLSCANRITYDSTPESTVPGVKIGEFTYTEDVVTPDYFKRVKKGEIILNPFYRSRTTNTSSGGSTLVFTSIPDACTGPSVKGVTTVIGAWFLKTYNSTVMNPQVESLIENSLMSRLQDEVWVDCLAKRQEGLTNLTESLAELDKSFKMIREPLVNLRTFIRDFRKSARRRKGYQRVKAQSTDIIRFASSEWLRFRYGISPIINDVKAAMKALKQGYDKVEPKLVKVRASGNITRSATSAGSVTLGICTINYQRALAHQYSCRAVHLDKYKPTIFNTVGLTYHNVVGLAWELTRYSFVIDWFTNVGSVIYANVPRVDLVSAGGTLTALDRQTLFLSPTSTVNNSPLLYTMSGAYSDNFLSLVETVHRRIPSDTYTPFVVRSDFRLDHFIRATDAFTLAMQALGSIKF